MSIDINLDERQSAIVFLSIACALFLAFIGFFAWHTARMRSYELAHVRMLGTVVDVERRHHTASSNYHGASGTYYYLVISYKFDGRYYEFTDRTGQRTEMREYIGKNVEIYVDPKNPESAETISSSGFVSIICACFFAFFCVTYAAGMNLLLSVKGSSFKKRLLCAWGVEVLLAVAFILLFWLGLPNSGFVEVFKRINGAVGLAVICQLVLIATLLDGVISFKVKPKN